MKTSSAIFVVMLLLNGNLTAQDTLRTKLRNEIGIGTSYFPLYFIIGHSSVNQYGYMVSYSRFITKNLGFSGALLYNTVKSDTLIPGRGHLVGLNAGGFYNFFSTKRIDFRLKVDAVFQKSITNGNYLGELKTITNEIHGGPALAFQYKISNRFSIQTETGISYGYEETTNYKNNTEVTFYECWCWYFHKFFGLQIIYKF